jgi:hypothetical protein
MIQCRGTFALVIAVESPQCSAAERGLATESTTRRGTPTENSDLFFAEL